MKKKQKKDKKYTKKGRIELKMLTENYLDVNRNDILDDIKKMNEASFRNMFKVIGNVLLPYRYPGDELEDESATDENKVNLLVSLHTNLEPLWKELKKEIFEHKEKVLPQRNVMDALQEEVKTTPSHALTEYKDLVGETGSDFIETYNSIKITKPRILPDRLKKIVIEANFDAGKINLIRKDQDIVNNFIKYLEGLPLEVF